MLPNSRAARSGGPFVWRAYWQWAAQFERDRGMKRAAIGEYETGLDVPLRLLDFSDRGLECACGLCEVRHPRRSPFM